MFLTKLHRKLSSKTSNSTPIREEEDLVTVEASFETQHGLESKKVTFQVSRCSDDDMDIYSRSNDARLLSVELDVSREGDILEDRSIYKHAGHVLLQLCNLERTRYPREPAKGWHRLGIV